MTFFSYADIAAQTTPLSETIDPNAVAASDSTVVATPLEYGLVVKSTALLRATSLLAVSEDLANLVGYNAGITADTLAEDVIEAGTNVIWGSGGATTPTSAATVQSDDTLHPDDVRIVVAALRGANVRPVSGGYYVGFIHPDAAYDFTGVTGEAGWVAPHVYSSPEAIMRGEVGAWRGVRFIETPRAPVENGGGSDNVDLYKTIFAGRQALALAHFNSEGYGRFPRVVRGPMVDALQRIQPIGWRHAIDYEIFRQAALRRVEHSSSLGTN